MCELFQFRPAYLQFPSDWWEDSPGTTLWTVAALGIAFLQSSRALRSCSSAALIKSLRVSMFRRPFEAVDRILGLHIKEDKHRPPVSTCLRLSLSLDASSLALSWSLSRSLSAPCLHVYRQRPGQCKCKWQLLHPRPRRRNNSPQEQREVERCLKVVPNPRNSNTRRRQAIPKLGRTPKQTHLFSLWLVSVGSSQANIHRKPK